MQEEDIIVGRDDEEGSTIKKGGMIQKEGIIAGRGDVYIRTL